MMAEHVQRIRVRLKRGPAGVPWVLVRKEVFGMLERAGWRPIVSTPPNSVICAWDMVYRFERTLTAFHYPHEANWVAYPLEWMLKENGR